MKTFLEKVKRYWLAVKKYYINVSVFFKMVWSKIDDVFLKVKYIYSYKIVPIAVRSGNKIHIGLIVLVLLMTVFFILSFINKIYDIPLYFVGFFIFINAILSLISLLHSDK